MSGDWSGLIGFAVALGLIALRVPVAVAMGLVGVVGTAWLADWSMVSFILANQPFEAVFPYGLSVVPLFIFMGVFAARAGLSRNLYEGVYAFVGHFRGGLGIATVGACAGFGAICGSSLATAATMSKVAIPQMRRRGYADTLAAASVAAGGTLGVLIPPSIILILYALLTEQSIGALFAAALIPGLLATLLYMGSVAVQVRLLPDLGPAGDRFTWRQRGHALLRIWDVVLLFAVVIGGIYAGVFSPTEAAAVGAAGAFLFAALRGQLSWTVLRQALSETAVTTGMIFLILIGAALFNTFVETSRLPQTLLGALGAADLGPLPVLLLVIAFYLVLGCFMDSLSMILLTVPFVFPVVVEAGWDPVWFGVVLVTIVELGLITPPIGMNLFIIQGTTPGLGLGTIVRGILPFIAADVLRIALLIAVPALVLWLPGLLGF